MIGLIFKLIKWTVITVAYLLVGLVKLVSIVVVLVFFTARAGVRRLLDAKGRRDDDEHDEYDLGYPHPMGRSSERLTRDAFDARWQRERDLRVAERSSRRGDGADPLAAPRSGGSTVDGVGNAAVVGPPHGSFDAGAATENGRVRQGTGEHRRDAGDQAGRGVTVTRR